jgi:hypothetical protein
MGVRKLGVKAVEFKLGVRKSPHSVTLAIEIA